ncbi:MAG: hypothetical protein WAT79_13235 [Saprospiraceae bacterium]
MNFTLHIFGNPNGYKQFPIDNLNNNFQDFREVINFTDKLIYYRNGELVQYIYTHELNNSGSYFGICLTFNGILCSEPIKLFSLFKDIFSDILQRNKLFIYTKNEYIYKAQNFTGEKQEIERIKQLFATSLDKDIQNDFVTVEGIVADIKGDPIRFKPSDKIGNIFAAMLQYNCVIISDGEEKIYVSPPPKMPSIKKVLAVVFIVMFSGVLFYFFKGLINPTPPTKLYLDDDRDGIGNIDSFIMSSESVDGYVSESGDANDNDPCVPNSSTKQCKNKDEKSPPKTKNIETKTKENEKSNGITQSLNYCPDLGKNVGDLCSDGDLNTEGDRVDENCTCVGNSKIPPPILDDNKDDDKDKVLNKSDRCPSRGGPSSNSGCPEIKIKTSGSIYKDQDFSVELEEFKSLNGDNVNWSVAIGSGTYVNSKAVRTTLRMSKPGLNTIQVDVSSSVDGLSGSNSKKICVEFSNTELTKIIDKARIKGNYDPDKFIPSSVKEAAEDALQVFKEISASNIQIKENSAVFGDDIESFILAKIMQPGSYLKSINVTPTYNKATCKVERITFNF